jgi:flagellar hook assembly protein FlgD
VTYENTQPGIPNIPVFTELKQVYPNPFNPNTNISYVLAQPSDVLITIFNMRGQEVRSFDSKNVAAGSQKLTWDGKDQNGTSLASGVYYIRMQAGADSFFKKAVLMK